MNPTEDQGHTSKLTYFLKYDLLFKGQGWPVLFLFEVRPVLSLKLKVLEGLQ